MTNLPKNEEEFSNIYHEIFRIRKKVLAQKKDAKSVSWTEKALTHEGITSCLIIILPTKGCSWAKSDSGGCSICGYINDSYHNVPVKIYEDFTEQLQRHNLDEIETVKIFNSGSFLDTEEISEEVQLKILKKLTSIESVKEIYVESRPEFILENTNLLQEYKKTVINQKLTFGIGLETTNDYTRKNFINKGFSYKAFINAAQVLSQFGFYVKAYLLFKPPFLFEKEAIEDIIRSVKDLLKLDIAFISINPATVHSYTLLEKFWRNDEYRPPWLWSILYVLEQISKLNADIPILCDLVNPGKERGPHNCNKCNNRVISVIKSFSKNQTLPESKILKKLKQCKCYTYWKAILEKEKYLGYPQRFEYRRPLLPRKHLD